MSRMITTNRTFHFHKTIFRYVEGLSSYLQRSGFDFRSYEQIDWLVMVWCFNTWMSIHIMVNNGFLGKLDILKKDFSLLQKYNNNQRRCIFNYISNMSNYDVLPLTCSVDDDTSNMVIIREYCITAYSIVLWSKATIHYTLCKHMYLFSVMHYFIMQRYPITLLCQFRTNSDA